MSRRTQSRKRPIFTAALLAHIAREKPEALRCKGCQVAMAEPHTFCLACLQAIRLRQGQRHHSRRLSDRAAWFALQLRRDPCSYCGRIGEQMTLDHIEPVHAGGRTMIGNGEGRLTTLSFDLIAAIAAGEPADCGNLTAACRRCNQRKGSDSALHFLARVMSEQAKPATRRNGGWLPRGGT